MRMFSFVLLLFMLPSSTHCGIRDLSFIRFCANVGEGVVKTTGTAGDTCKVTYQVPVSDNDEAIEYCNNWDMFPVIDAKEVNGQPVCIYENVYECESDYTLIKGYCYKFFSRSMVTFENAKNTCENEKSSITGETLKARILHLFDRDYIIRMFRAYFTNLSIVFIQPSGDFDSSKQIAGNNFAITFGSSSVYKVGFGTVIGLSEKERAKVMCVYRAQETILSFAFKAKKLLPYYPFISINSELTVWRTANQYHVGRSRNVNLQVDKCKASMKAIVGDSATEPWDATKTNVQRLDPKFKQSLVFSLLPYSYCCEKRSNGESRFYENCPDEGWTHRVLRTLQKNTLQCSGYSTLSENEYSTHFKRRVNVQLPIPVIFYPTQVNGESIQSRAIGIDAPVLCNLYFANKQRPTKCENGWSSFKRDTDFVVCHKVFKEKKSFDDAGRFCADNGGALSTFTHEDEYDLLQTLIDQTELRYAWIGLRKSRDCPRVGPGKCERLLIVDFDNPRFGEDTFATRELISTLWHKTWDEPNNVNNDEYCIELSFMYPFNVRERLNDLACSWPRQFACVKAATEY